MHLTHKTKSFTLIFLAIILNGCSYYGTYEFVIYNALQDTIYIDLSRKQWYPLEPKDSSIFIRPHREYLIYSRISEEIQKGGYPKGLESQTIEDFNYMNITVSGKTISKNFLELNYWNYELINGQTGRYTLFVNDTLIK
jgi:hypothetical protein